VETYGNAEKQNKKNKQKNVVFDCNLNSCLMKFTFIMKKFQWLYIYIYTIIQNVGVGMIFESLGL